MRFCKTSNVWTRKKCRTCDEIVPSWLFRSRKQTVEERLIVRYESSSSDESLETLAVLFRIAAERNRRERRGANIAKLEAELTGANADSGANRSSGIVKGQGESEGRSGQERGAEKKQEFPWRRLHYRTAGLHPRRQRTCDL